MSKSSSSQSKTKSSEKGSRKETIVKTANSPLMGSLGRFLGFFVPGLGFGGSFAVILFVILMLFFWADHNNFWGTEQKWLVVFNQPAGVWEKIDVLHEVQQNHPSLFERSYDDPKLLEDISNSFNLVPIVKKVKSAIRRYPNQIILDVEYYVPIAMVYVHSTSPAGYLPVDKEGYLLPSQTCFTSSDVTNYITIHGIESLPVNPVGQKWNDICVEFAAQIANEITPYKEELGFVSILVHEGTSQNDYYNPTLFDVRLTNGTYIRWMSATIKQAGEVTLQNSLLTEEKISILRNRLRVKGKILPDKPNEILSFEQEKK